jgi:hypothetical protein
MDFIFMLTRADRTIEDAAYVVDAVAECGVRHIGFKDIGVSADQQVELVERIRHHGGTSYLEVVSTTPEAILRSLEAARDLGVDCILGGTDVDAAAAILGDLGRYFPFPGEPVGHPTRLGGTPARIEADARRARARGCGGVDLLAYRATEADPVDLVVAARRALTDGRLIVAGSVQTVAQIHALARAGADAFTIGSAVFDGAFSPTKGSLHGQVDDILAACRSAPARVH